MTVCWCCGLDAEYDCDCSVFTDDSDECIGCAANPERAAGLENALRTDKPTPNKTGDRDGR